MAKASVPTREVAPLPEVRCPAGEHARMGTAVRCRVEHQTIETARDARVVATVLRHCCGDYATCSTWRAERDRRTAAPLVEAR